MECNVVRIRNANPVVPMRYQLYIITAILALIAAAPVAVLSHLIYWG
jgi:hypothetical protein